jgi:hypothetical protein
MTAGRAGHARGSEGRAHLGGGAHRGGEGMYAYRDRVQRPKWGGAHACEGHARLLVGAHACR